jgi:outer membrane protein assembly factor BamA
VEIAADTRDKVTNPRRGLFVAGEGRFYPAVWDVMRAFGSAEARAETYLSAGSPLSPTLAVRAGGKKLWGTFPFFESAFIGGPSSVRGYYQQRFAGDASLSGSAELRVTLARTHGFLPAYWGLFGNTDAGRVYLDGRSPGGWHTGTGGGGVARAPRPRQYRRDRSHEELRADIGARRSGVWLLILRR